MDRQINWPTEQPTNGPTNQPTNQLTTHCRVILEKLVVPQPVKKYLAFYGTQSLPMVPILCQINPLHIIPSHFLNICYHIIHHLCQDLASGSFLWVSPPQPCMHFISPHTCHLHCPSHTPWCDHPNNIRSVQIMKIPIKHSSPISKPYRYPLKTQQELW